MMLGIPRRRGLAWMVVAAVVALVVTGRPQRTFAGQSEPKTFSSPGEASEALFQAAESHDEQALDAIFGADNDVSSTNDHVEDRVEREQFCQRYKQMRRLVREPDGTTVLYVGAENWPFPIPLTSSNGRWSFDAKTGKQEMLFRRIGENEAAAIEVCRALIAPAPSEAADAGSDDPIHQFAESMASRTKTGSGNDIPGGAVQTEPFYGYYFRTVGAPAAKTAAGSAGTTESTNKESRPACVAYPAEYLSSGVMTFIVRGDGSIHEKDLGPETSKLAIDVETKPAAGWRAVK
jgi:hypothetical protein